MERLWQAGATHGNGFRLFSTVSGTIAFATSCHRLQPRGSIKAPSAFCRMSSRLSSTNSARDVRRTDHTMNTRVRCSTRKIFALLPERGGHPLLVPPGDARDAGTRPRRAPRGKTRSTRSRPSRTGARRLLPPARTGSSSLWATQRLAPSRRYFRARASTSMGGLFAGLRARVSTAIRRAVTMAAAVMRACSSLTGRRARR
jgi:hypothetical protein